MLNLQPAGLRWSVLERTGSLLSRKGYLCPVVGASDHAKNFPPSYTLIVQDTGSGVEEGNVRSVSTPERKGYLALFWYRVLYRIKTYLVYLATACPLMFSRGHLLLSYPSLQVALSLTLGQKALHKVH